MCLLKFKSLKHGSSNISLNYPLDFLIGNRFDLREFLPQGFCYTYRQDSSCMMKEGNPFGPFWDNFKVDFDSYVEYGAGLNYEASSQNARKWNER